MALKFYKTGSGRAPAKEFLDELSVEVREEFLTSTTKLESGEMLFMPISRNMSNMFRGLHELRIKDDSGDL